MAMIATLRVINPPVITGQPVSAILTVQNTGAAPVNMVSIQGFVLPITAGAIPDSEVLMPPQVQVAAGGSQQYDLTYIITAPQVPGIISGTYTLAATCYSDDGSVFSAQVGVAATPAVPVQAGGQGGWGVNAPQFGQLGYDFGRGFIGLFA